MNEQVSFNNYCDDINIQPNNNIIDFEEYRRIRWGQVRDRYININITTPLLYPSFILPRHIYNIPQCKARGYDIAVLSLSYMDQPQLIDNIYLAQKNALNKMFGGSHTFEENRNIIKYVVVPSYVSIPLESTKQEPINNEQIKKNQKAISLLDSWLKDTNKGNVKEQAKSLRLLKKTLDKDRQSYRKLYS